MKNLTWQNPEQLFVAQELINKVKSKCCGIKVYDFLPEFSNYDDLDSYILESSRKAIDLAFSYGFTCKGKRILKRE